MKKLGTLLLLTMTLGLSGCFMLPSMDVNSQGSSKYHPKLIPIDNKLAANNAKLINQYEYKIGPQDQLSVAVWSHAEFNSPSGDDNLNLSGHLGTAGLYQNLNQNQPITDYQVDADGDIFFPLIGTVNVLGNTPQDVQAMLTNLLATYVKNPQITVRVDAFKSQQVYVMGEVMQPEMQVINNVPLTLEMALTAAGGLNPMTANMSQIYVIRGDSDSPKVYWLDETNPAALLLSQSFLLQSHDVVYVSTAGISQWNRVITQILPTTESVFNTRSTPRNQPN